MSPKADTTTTIRALNDALNARDREATAALFATDGVFRPGAAGAVFEGPDAIIDSLFGFLDLHKSGQFEVLHEMFTDDEAYNEWNWVGITNDGEPSETHGCDHYIVREGKIALKNTFRKA
jgi:ketosteroid isomerase-like protein